MKKGTKYLLITVAFLVLEMVSPNYTRNIMQIVYIPAYPQVIGRVLLGVAVAIAYVLSISLLFAWLFSEQSIKLLFHKKGILAMSLALVTRFLFVTLIAPLFYNLTGTLSVNNYDIYLFTLGALECAVMFLIILVFICKPLKISFKIKAKPIFLMLLLCWILSSVHIYFASHAIDGIFNTNMNSVTNSLSLLLHMNNFEKIQSIVTAIVATLEHLIIFICFDKMVVKKTVQPNLQLQNERIEEQSS